MLQSVSTGQTTTLPAPLVRSTVRVMLLDQQRLFHACVDALLQAEQDLEYVGGFASLQGIISSIRDLQPDVVLVDLGLVGGGFADFVARIEQAAPRSRIIALAAEAGSANIQSAIEAGTAGYVLKTASSSELMAAVRAVSTGEQFLCQGAARTVGGALRSGRRNGIGGSSSVITKREREVLACVVAGNSNKSTARMLGMSPKTVSKHRTNLMRKLNLSSVSGLAQFAYRYGLTG